jgi:hypothetical protein
MQIDLCSIALLDTFALRFAVRSIPSRFPVTEAAFRISAAQEDRGDKAAANKCNRKSPKKNQRIPQENMNVAVHKS